MTSFRKAYKQAEHALKSKIRHWHIAKVLSLLMEGNLLDARRRATRKPTTLYYVHPDVLTEGV